MANGESISPQTGLPSYMKVPNTFRLPKEMIWAGITHDTVKLLAGFMVILAIPAVSTIFIKNIWYQCFATALDLVAIIIILKYFRNHDMYLKNKLTIQYMIDEYKKKHGVYKFDADLDFLLKYVPIVEIHPGGIIEFIGNRFGILMRYYPPDVQDDQVSLEDHIEKVKVFIHRMSSDMLIRFISCSRYQFVSPILKKLQERMNESDIPKPMFRLLVSLFDKIKSTKDNSGDVDFYLFVAFDANITSYELAVNKLNEKLPGIEDGLKKADISANMIQDRKQLIIEYRNFFNPLGVVKDVLN